jgi:tripartite-type tricarboxylate transporter receptor subunit TctC
LTSALRLCYLRSGMKGEKSGQKSHREIVRRRSRSLPHFLLLILVLGIIVPGFGQKTEYPKKPIVWIVPYQPGGGYDTYSRAIAKILPKYLPHPVKIVVKNVAGAGGRQGAATLFRSKPDGYTIGLLNLIGLFSSEFVKKSNQYDADKFTYLVTCSRGTPGLYVSADSDFNTIEDLQKQERIRFASGGKGSSTWLWGMLTKGILDIPVYMISGYLGTSDYVTAVLRKDAEALVLGFSSAVIPYCLSGELKPVIIFSREPLDWLPDAPLVAGTPFEQLADLKNDRVIAAPPGLPEEILGILEKSLLEAMNDPDLKAWSRETNNPFFIDDAAGTLKSIQEMWALLKKYEKFLRD